MHEKIIKSYIVYHHSSYTSIINIKTQIMYNEEESTFRSISYIWYQRLMTEKKGKDIHNGLCYMLQLFIIQSINHLVSGTIYLEIYSSDEKWEI